MIKKLLLLCLCTFTFLNMFAQNQVFLVKNGRANAVIIIENENISTKKAGEELQEMLLKRTGAKLEIISAKSPIPTGMIPVYLGLSPKTAGLGADEKQLPYDGYFFKATKEYVVIAGRDIPQTDEAYAGHTFINIRYFQYSGATYLHRSIAYSFLFRSAE